ncbi:MAG TPA: class I SAM-dependent methyltransferase [Allosphingosinicella sp.]|jgi:SAM-dependent methyltransferase
MSRDKKTIEAFDANWSQRAGEADRFAAAASEAERSFRAFFSIFPLASVADGEGFELGCGSGRIAQHVARRVGFLHCIEPTSGGIEGARERMAAIGNAAFHQVGVDDMPLADGSQDFGYSVGVLHHVPDTEGGLGRCVDKLKLGAPFLLYLYYRFDNRPAWFRGLWRASDLMRRGIARLPFAARRAASTSLAVLVYWPLSRAARAAERAGLDVERFPLAYYRASNLTVLRYDALDRFGTRLEQRFTRAEIEAMMRRCGLERIAFREGPPYWVAVGYKTDRLR